MVVRLLDIALAYHAQRRLFYFFTLSNSLLNKARSSIGDPQTCKILCK